MTKKHRLSMWSALPLLAIGACTGGTDDGVHAPDNGITRADGSADDGDGQRTSGTAEESVSAAPMTGRDFADRMAASDAYAIAAGKLARQKATTAELRDFGREMIDDHGASTEKLKAAARTAIPAIMPAPALTEEQQANLQTLRSATGTAFDAAYKNQQVVAHEKTLAGLKAYARSGDVPALRTFASEAQDVVSLHYDRIKGL